MPTTIHKVLIHAKYILKNFVLPAGYFGEEAKNTNLQERYASKNSRINNLEDIFLLEERRPLIQLFLA